MPLKNALAYFRKRMSYSKERFARSALRAASLSKSDRIESKEAAPSLFNFKRKLVENFETEK
jgi:hypothetical protein